MAEQLIARRGALKYLGMLTATAAGRGFLASWLPQAARADDIVHLHRPTASAEQSQSYVPQFFSAAEYETVDLLTEMIIPRDDKPGAHDAQVASYIDFIVWSAAEFEPQLQQQWTRGLKLLEQLSQQQFSRGFRNLTEPQRERLLTEISAPERDPEQTHPGFDVYRLLKAMTVEGFYTSKLGLLEALEYQGLTFLAEFPGCTHPEHQASS
jgi:hypothetical protein